MEGLKAKLKRNKATIGSWITIADPAVTEIMAKSGFDWLAIDLEHSAISIGEAANLIRIIELCGIAPLVRVSENNPTIIKRAMDAGAHGVIVPMVNTKEEAVRAVSAVKYPPVGTRGVGLGRAQGYGLKFERYRSWVNKGSVVIVQIEHIQAVKNLKEILSVEGVDGSMIGPYDLSGSLGIPGEFDREEVKEAIATYETVCRKMKKPMGYHVIQPNAEEVKERLAKGYTFLPVSLETLYLGLRLKDFFADLKKRPTKKA
ncbi:MAG: aldolase/citrate lyase family protein [Patescibacteria group bacterium]